MPAVDVIQKLVNSPTHVVVVYLGTSDMTRLLQAKANSSIVNAENLIFISPEPYTNLVKDYGGFNAVNMLSLRLKTPNMSNFMQYLNNKTTSGFSDNPFFARYYMEVFNCNLPGYYSRPGPCRTNPSFPLPLLTSRTTFEESNFLMSTINAVFAITAALDATLTRLCGENYNGTCPTFANSGELNNLLLDGLRLTNFDYANSNFRFLNREGNTGYDVLRFNGNNYQTVGSYEGAGVQFTSDINAVYQNVPSGCNSPCLECIQQGLNFSYVPGDILLGGLFDVHEQDLNPFTCGDINTLHGFQLLEAFHFALGRVNSKEGMFANILRGTTLGGIGLDSCESAIRTGYLVSNIQNGLTSLAKNGYRIDTDDIDAYIGSYASDSSLYLARILADLKIPQISYAATSTALLDEYLYPYFYRTVPADDNQAKAMLSFLDANDIRYVQILYTQSNYGEFGAAAFERLAPSMRICVAQMVVFPDNGTVYRESSNDVVTQLLAKPVANTVVVFADTRYITALLQAVNRIPGAIGKFRFIGSETWANNEDAILGVENMALGSVTFSLRSVDLKVFDEYLIGKTPANSQENPWFGEYYEEIQNCYLTVSDGRYPVKCPQTPKDIASSVRYKQDPGLLHVINAVYSAAFAIDLTLKEKCGENYTAVCEAYKNGDNTKERILENLKSVNFIDPSGEYFNFTDRREGSKGYDMYSIENVPVRGFVYRRFGSYSSSGTLDLGGYKADWDGSCARQDACSECPTIRNTGIRYAVTEPATANEDTITVVGVFDVHKQGTDPYRCGELNDEGFRQFLYFFYTMQELINTFNLNIRAVAIDTCSNSQRVGQDLYNLLAGRGLCNSEFLNPNPLHLDNIAGFVVSGNENTWQASRILDPFKISYISPSAPSIVFNDTVAFPYLARTMAPNGLVMQVLGDILKNLGYDYVTAVSSSWKFEDSGYSQFLSVSDGKTCVRSLFQLSVGAKLENAVEAVQQLMGAAGSNVVILFTTREDSILILQAAKQLGVLDRFFWVFTDRSAAEIADWTLPAGLRFEGLVFKERTTDVQGYIDYATGIRYRNPNDQPALNERNIPKSWYEEYYQKHFECKLPGAGVPIDSNRICNKSEIFEGRYRAKQDRYALPTIAAAYALVNGIADFRTANCTSQNVRACIAGTPNARDQIFQRILGIAPVQLDDIADVEGTFLMSFNSQRFWDAGLVAWRLLVETSPNGKTVSMSRFADWDGNTVRVDSTAGRNLMADFTSTCPTGLDCGCAKPEVSITQPVVAPETPTEPRNYYLYGDDGTKIHEWPVWAIAVAVVTCIGIIITVLSALILLFTYPVRGGTTVLGFMVLLGIIGIYAINFAFFLPAAFETCAARRFCMGVIYMIVFAALLVKAVDNWRYGDLEWGEQKKYRGLTSSCSLFMVAVGIVLIQAIIPIEWIILVAPTASKLAEGPHDYWWCDPTDMYDIGLVLSFIFVIFILLLTAIFSAMSWDSEANNRESRWILIGCICTAGCFLVWMIVTTNAGPTFRDPAVAIANFVNATALLVCIPLRKMVLLFQYKMDEGKEKPEEGPYNNIYSDPNVYNNAAFDNDYEYQRQDSKQDSDVGF